MGSDSAVRAYRVVAKVKNNRLWSAIMATFPEVRTQSGAARALGVHPALLGTLLNMVWWPYSRQAGWAPSAHRIAETLKDTPDYLFDGELYGRKPARPLSLEFDMPALQASGMLAPVTTPEEALERQQLGEGIASAFERLTPDQRMVIERRFGLAPGGTEESLEEVAAHLGISRAAVWSHEGAALRKLRAPLASRILRHYTEGTPLPPMRPPPAAVAKPTVQAKRPACPGSQKKPKTGTRTEHRGWNDSRWIEGACRECARRRIGVTKAGTLARHRPMAPEAAAKAEGWTYYPPEYIAEVQAANRAARRRSRA